jgi:hypothetical protein
MPKQKLEIERGKTYNMSYTHPTSMAGGTVYFTVKSAEYDTDATDASAAIPPKNITSFTNGNLTASWTLTDEDTYITPGKYYYDIVFENSAGESLPASWWGEVKVTGRPTNRNAQ